MYKSFYHLRRNPFEVSPDPFFMYPTVRHREALASLYYGIRERKGFVVLTGEVGTGKTMVVRCLLDRLSEKRIPYAYVVNPRLSSLEFLHYVAGDLGLSVDSGDKGKLLLQLNRFLVERRKAGQITVLVVDEAHLLSDDVLEEIRLLTNLETSREKLLQIALVGQPELDEALDSNELRQLKQRIALRYQLLPLNPKETAGYVRWRLRLAGARDGAVEFPAETLEAIWRHSRGIPRLVNTICENALINAYSASSRTVALAHVREAVEDLRLEPPVPARASRSRPESDWRTLAASPEFFRAVKELMNVMSQDRASWQARPDSLMEKKQ